MNRLIFLLATVSLLIAAGCSSTPDDKFDQAIDKSSPKGKKSVSAVINSPGFQKEIRNKNQELDRIYYGERKSNLAEQKEIKHIDSEQLSKLSVDELKRLKKRLEQQAARQYANSGSVSRKKVAQIRKVDNELNHRTLMKFSSDFQKPVQQEEDK